MRTGNNMLRNYDEVLDREFGKVGTPEREAARAEAEQAYAADLLRMARREARMTQAEVAAKMHVTKSYISRIENGVITPSMVMFYRFIDALGMRVEIVRPIG